MHFSRKRKTIFYCLLWSIIFSTIIGYGISARKEINKVFAEGSYEVFDFNDYLFFDPINPSNTNCNESNYWTLYDQDTTCYRWAQIDFNDNSNKENIRLILDHDIGYASFTDYQSVLQNNTADWKDYIGEVSLLSEDDVDNILGITSSGKSRPIPGGGNVTGNRPFRHIVTNMQYYINGEKTNHTAFWTSDSYDDQYAYVVSIWGKNLVMEKYKKIGVRPVVTVPKKIVTRPLGKKNITNIIDSANSYSYESRGEFNGNVFKVLQGFTITNENLVFYSSNSVDTEHGVLSAYNGNDYQNLLKKEYDNTGHGNGMTFDSEDNIVILSDENMIYRYDGTTLEKESEFNIVDRLGIEAHGIGYDYVHDSYVIFTGWRAFFVNKNLDTINYSFDVPFEEPALQDVEYRNGYIYYVVWMNNCSTSNPSPLDCPRPSDSSIIYVYNAKFNEDGTPSKNFGRLVNEIYIAPGHGELEGIVFHGDKTYLGYSYGDIDKNNPFKFFYFDYDQIMIEPEMEISYKDLTKSTTVIISSKDQLLSITGYTKSEDGHSLSKTIEDKIIQDNIEICDHYDNCKTISIDHTNNNYINAENQHVSFANNNITKTYGDANFTNVATTTGDGAITYSSSDTSIAEVNSETGEVSIKSAGETTITATAAATDNYNSASASYTLRVDKRTAAVSFANNNITKTYGDANFTNVATTTGDSAITYISNNTAVATINSVTGEVSINGAGTAVITASASATDYYETATASYVLIVNKKKSIKPKEVDKSMTGYITDSLSTIKLETEGLVWDNEKIKIKEGENNYKANYTEHADINNYTTESFEIIVIGEHRIYKTIEGDNQTYILNSDKYMIFKFDAKYELFKEGGSILIDSKIVDKQHYISESGSTIIKISDEYLATLPTGNHVIDVLLNDGGIATAEFKLEEKNASAPNTGYATEDHNSLSGLNIFEVVGMFATLVYFSAFILKRIKDRKKVDF